MGNWLENINRSLFSGGSIETYNPIDVLYDVNPELGALAYANKERILTPEVMPLIAKFRELQSGEKIELMRNMVRKLGIESHEREVMAAIEGRINMTKLTEDGMTDRQRIVTSGENYRSDNNRRIVETQAKNELDIQRIKYATDAKIVNDYIDGQRYVSDNEAEARRIEAEARRDAVKFANQMRGDAMKQVSKNQLEDRLAGYNTEIRKAEIERELQTSLKYIDRETAMQSMNLQAQIERARDRGQIGLKVYDTLAQGVIEATRLLSQRTSEHGVVGEVNSDFGGFNYKVRFMDKDER